MKYLLFTVLLLGTLTVSALAVELPAEVEEALPRSAERWMEEPADSDGIGLTEGVLHILSGVMSEFASVFRGRLRGVVSILLVVLLCGSVRAGEPEAASFVRIAGALSVTVLTMGSMHGLMGLGMETIRELSDFSEVLLPALAAVTAAAGGVSTASVQQITVIFFADLLLRLTQTLLLPLVRLYVGLLTAGACLPENHLDQMAEGLKKGISWLLTGGFLLFTGYLSAVRIISGSVDRTAVSVTKAALKGLVPVVGSILSQAAETVLAGAGMLRNAIGVFGMLGVLAACAYPFLQLGIQFALYKITGFLCVIVGEKELCGLIQGLGGAFGLILGMVGGCASLLLIAILGAVSAVAL